MRFILFLFVIFCRINYNIIMKKKILVFLLSFLFLGTAVTSGVLLSSDNFSQSEENNGDIDNNYDGDTGATAEVPLNTDGTWLSEGGRFATSFAGGSGTESDPYEIETAGQLAFLSYVVRYANSFYADLYYEQTANIDVSAYYWYPIGSISSTYAFKGHYDGGGYTISGIYTRSGSSYQGLFGYIAATSSSLATIENVNVNDSYIQGYQYVGGIVGAGYAQYSAVISNSENIISNCSFDGSVSGGEYVGGIVGYAQGTFSSSYSLYNCFNYGNIIDNGSLGRSLGGIAGGMSYFDISNCENSGYVYATSSSAGGIVGDMGSHSSIFQCYNKGNVESTSTYIGGIAGHSSYSSTSPNSIAQCQNDGNVSGTTYIGGIIGYSQNDLNINNSFNMGSVDGTGTYVGGLVGAASGSYLYVQNSYNVGPVISTSSTVGGIAGSFSSAYMDNCFNVGYVSLSSTSYIGGLAGQASSGYLRHSFWGGDCGIGQASGYSGNITNSYYIGNLKENARSRVWYESDIWNTSYPWNFDEIWGISENANM